MTERCFDRLRRTATFRDGGHERWRRARLGVIGAGALGGPLAVAIARSGARVTIIDPQDGAEENLGTQLCRAGEAKARTVAAACNHARHGAAQALIADVRRLGPGALRGLDVLCDCTDDPGLALYLTEVSNGLGVPLLRLAVDGSGQSEMGRIRCSAGGSGMACQVCGWDAADLLRALPRTPCPGEAAGSPPPTLAGGALSMAIAGAGLLQAERLVTGNDAELVWNRELILDLTRGEILSARLARSADCLSGHARWRLIDVLASAAALTLGRLFALCQNIFAPPPRDVAIEPFGHPLCVEARCACGREARACGAAWAAPPRCACGASMSWRRETAHVRLSAQDAADLGVADTPLSALGLPETGALLVAHAPDHAPTHLLLAGSAHPQEIVRPM
ncbi:MAG: ThiF family adenylyltransferase [Planctomycetes bacterium]|nr:ThiF family adenylyltransferase [Planctomycetota bacterium]